MNRRAVWWTGIRDPQFTLSAGISVPGEDITQTLGGDMARPRCDQKESLEVSARKAVAYEKGLESTLPEPEERKDALERVELAGLNLRDHLANCDVCRQPS
jgi:hypothetical protein